MLQTAFQTPGTAPAQPGSAPAAGLGALGVQEPVAPLAPTARDIKPLPEQERLKLPAPTLDPGGSDPVDINTVPIPRLEPGRRADRGGSSGFQAQLSPVLTSFNEALASGFPSNTRPYVVTPAEALQLALMNSRAYQFRLENVYVQALAVTLSRFGFQPNFYAGFSPTTGGSNGIGIPNNTTNNFNYRTKETIGGQNSTLSLGSAAGITKFLSFGGRFAAGFANQTIFNFLSNNPSQPTVTSFLPITFAQPFLRGAGRAVTLEPLTNQERLLLYEVRNFARFRQTVVPAFLTANQQLDGGQGTATDPQPGYLFVIQALQRVENDRRTVAAYEQLLKLYREYVIGGASSGISQIQVDQVASNLASQKGSLLADEASYKAAMDNYRTSLGLPPDLPMILDRAPLASFRNVFNNLDKWAAQEEHDPEDLNGIIGQLPRLESIVIDGRQLFEYKGTLLTQDYADGEKQQEFLLAGERVALENRVDLMNQRAQLYDAWRNLAVQANGLKGVFNVNLSNTITTAPGNSNPLGFIDQAKQFSVSFNTELPLVRVAERNQYRLATITYNRQQRILQNAEDSIKLAIRQEVYQLIAVSENFEINRTNLLINVRQRDLSLQNIIAPPTSIDASNAAQQATQTNNLITGINSILNIQQQLISNWVQFQVLRLALYRDLGLMPYDEWEAFYEFFPSGSGQGLLAPAGDNGPAPAGPAAIAPPGGGGA